MLRLVIPVLFALSGLLSVSALAADTIRLKSGESVQGLIRSQSRDSIRIETVYGFRTIRKTDASRVSYEPYDLDAAKARLAEQRQSEREEAAERLRQEQEQEAAELEEERQRIEQQDTGPKPDDPIEVADNSQTYSQISLSSALWRSALLPGWGQMHQGRSGIGYAYGFAFAGVTVLALHQRSTFEDRRRDYDFAANRYLVEHLLPPTGAGAPAVFASVRNLSDLSGARGRRSAAARRYSQAGYLLAGFYLWNLTDIVLFQPAASESVNLSFGDTLEVRYGWNF